MFHTIEFRKAGALDIQTQPMKPLERVTVRVGTRFKAQIKPYVTKTKAGIVETADLFFEDGTSAAGVPFACFCFVE